MKKVKTIPNPDLFVHSNNKQGWNQPENRRHGFHNTYRLFRRGLMSRAKEIVMLEAKLDQKLEEAILFSGLCNLPSFSALVIAENGVILHQSAAKDFDPGLPHSIQSISKMFIHLIYGQLIATGLIDPKKIVSYYLPQVGSAYASATVQDVLDMNVTNDFSENYDDPLADCYREEEALGWRIPSLDAQEPTLEEFVISLTGQNLENPTDFARYKSANTDILTVIAAQKINLFEAIEQITDAAGFEGALYCSISSDLLPAFSGGISLSARDLARFGLLLARTKNKSNHQIYGKNTSFTVNSVRRSAPKIFGREGQRYSNHLMTNGYWIGHAGYGGQFLMVDIEKSRSIAFLSVLENSSGYDETYMAEVIKKLEKLLIL